MFGFRKKKTQKHPIEIRYAASSEGLVIEAVAADQTVSFFASILELESFDTKNESFKCYRAFRQFVSCLTPDECETLQIASDDSGRLQLGWEPLLVAREPRETEEVDSGDQEVQSVYSELISEVFSEASPIHLSLDNQGTFREKNFKISHRYSDSGGNRLYPPDGAGGVVQAGRLFLLSRQQYELVQALQGPWPPDHHAKHLHWAELQRQAEEANAHLSQFLENERATLIDTVRPKVFSPEPGVIELSAEISHGESERIVSDILQSGEAKEVYSYATPGQRHRVFPTQQVRRAIESIREHRRLEGEDAARFLQDPQSILNQDCWDLSEFSDRVQKVGFHVYRPVEAVGGVGGVGDYVWEEDETGRRASVQLRFASLFPGGEPLVIDISDPETEKEIKKQVSEAIAANQDYLEVQPGHMVPLYAFPQNFLRPPSPDENEGEKTSKNLTVQPVTNLEELEYGAADQVYSEADETLELPDSLAPGISLHWYQKDGYQKIGKVALGKISNASGFLLADDMGLGKTLQVLTVLAKLAQEGRKGPHLIVAKPSLLENWTRELQRFFPSVYTWPIQVNKHATLPQLRSSQIVLSSYAQLRRRQLDLARVNWDAVILDEAQKIKDPTTQVTRAAWALPAKTRIAMTGTPIENSLTDLWSISNFFQPGLLDSLSGFRQAYQRSSGVTTNLENLRETLDPLFLRRTKDQVATDLPPIESVRYELPMGARQQELYEREMEARRTGTRSPLETVNRLLQLCTHASLIDYSELWPCSEEQCPKLFKTFEILENVRAAGEKALIFTKFIKAQHTLQQAIKDKFGINAPIINGSTRDRQSIIDNFSAKSGFSVLILSPEAAGVGLNITAANHVIHFTRSWNPAIERQSTDRAYRLGQTRPVTVYYPIIVDKQRGTIEQRLDELLERKMGLFNDIFVPLDDKQIRASELLA